MLALLGQCENRRGCLTEEAVYFSSKSCGLQLDKPIFCLYGDPAGSNSRGGGARLGKGGNLLPESNRDPNFLRPCV
jgi:hypothetical protein